MTAGQKSSNKSNCLFSSMNLCLITTYKLFKSCVSTHVVLDCINCFLTFYITVGPTDKKPRIFILKIVLMYQHSEHD